jgi:hypothetical protein
MGRLLMLSTPAKVNVVGMVVAAAGILIEYFSGVEGFPTVPPGPFILVGAAALVAWGRGAGRRSSRCSHRSSVWCWARCRPS